MDQRILKMDIDGLNVIIEGWNGDLIRSVVFYKPDLVGVQPGQA